MNKLNFKIDVLSTVILINVGLFAILTLISVVLDVNYSEVTVLLGSHVDGISWITQRWWRMIVSSFLHADEWHLISNLIGIYFVGKWVQLYYGGKSFFLVYFLGGVAGAIASEIFLDNFSSIGASAGYFALLGLVIANVLMNDPERKPFPWSKNVILLILVLLAAEAVFNVAGREMVNNAAHFGGFVIGAAYGYFIKHFFSVNIPSWQVKFQYTGYKVALFATIAAFIGMILNIVLIIFFYDL